MIELSDNPKDYGLEYDGWWRNQKDAITREVNLEPGKVFVLESPTGSGKSAGPATVSHFRPGTATLCATRDLQKQYFADQGFAIVWGQEHYPCSDPQHIQDYLSIYNDKPSRADCPHRKVRDCQYFLDCEYECAKMRAMEARAKVFNLAYAYHTKWWRKDGRDWDLFCDEAHRLPEALSGLISEDVGNWVRRKYYLDPFPVVKGGLRKHLTLSCVWLESSVAKLLPFTRQRDKKRARDALRANRLRMRLQALRKTLQVAEPESWYIESIPKRFVARPVIPGDYASRVITPEARSLVFMSATIGKPDVMLAELGLGDREFEFLTLPHIFPLANRPVIWLQGCPRIRYKTTEKEYDRQAQIIANLIKRHKGEKGLIHTASWHYSKALCERLGRMGVGDRIMLAEGKRIETVKKFKRSNSGTVAVSPSWQEGLNFPDEELRFAIISKVPWQSMADPIVRMRVRAKGGNDWYKWKAALKIVQAAGRGVRHANDWCVTYIADGLFPKVKEFCPEWFEVTRL